MSIYVGKTFKIAARGSRHMERTNAATLREPAYCKQSRGE